MTGRAGSDVKGKPTPRDIANRYRIESKIGEGGMGVVYRARDPLTK